MINTKGRSIYKAFKLTFIVNQFEDKFGSFDNIAKYAFTFINSKYCQPSESVCYIQTVNAFESYICIVSTIAFLLSEQQLTMTSIEVKKKVKSIQIFVELHQIVFVMFFTLTQLRRLLCQPKRAYKLKLACRDVRPVAGNPPSEPIVAGSPNANGG